MYKIIALIILIGTVSMLCAQQPVSMRNLALGSVIDGEWEGIYDPIELQFYPQKYYFTNLSDYVQKIRVYDNTTEYSQKSQFLSEYPFGFTFANPFYKAARSALLIRFKDTQIPNLTTGYGESESISSSYADFDGDLIYDTWTVTKNKNVDYNDIGSRLSLMLNNSLPWDDKVLGIRLSLDHEKSKWDEASYNFSAWDFCSYLNGYYVGDHTNQFSYHRYDLINDQTLLSYQEEGKFATSTSNDTYQLLLSLMQPTDLLKADSELRYDLTFSLTDNGKSQTRDSYQGEYDSYTNESVRDYGNYDEKYTRNYSVPRTEIFASTKFRHNLDTPNDRLKQSFWEFSLGLGGFGGSCTNEVQHDLSYIKHLADSTFVEGTETESYGYQTKSGSTGDYLGLHSRLTGRSSVYLSDYVCFGYGFSMDLQSYDRQTDNKYSTHAVEEHQEGSGFDSAADTRTTNTMSYSFELQHTQTDLQTLLPVGLEFYLPQSSLSPHDAFSLRNFAFRLGTTFIHNLTTIDDRGKLTDLQVNTYISETGDGSVTESHPNNITINTGNNQSRNASGSKRYSAGIGYNHSANLSIDLGGYVDSNGEDFFVGAMFTVRR
jgi:hypothetical protein